MSKFEDDIEQIQAEIIKDKDYIVTSVRKQGEDKLSGLDKNGNPVKIKKYTKVYLPPGIDNKKYTGNTEKEVKDKIKDNKPDSLKSVSIKKELVN